MLGIGFSFSLQTASRGITLARTDGNRREGKEWESTGKIGETSGKNRKHERCGRKGADGKLMKAVGWREGGGWD